MSTKEEWVRVESESELRPGMTVRVELGKELKEAIVDICGFEPPSRFTLASKDEREFPDCYLTGFPQPWSRLRVGPSIEDGRLYRLSDLTDDSETTDATKELVTT